MARRITSNDENDAFTSWRQLLHWQPGELAKVKRRYHHRERREARAEMSEYNEPDPGRPEEWEWLDPTYRHRSRKDRRRWCRGKTGVPHAWVHTDVKTWPWSKWILHIDACANCGRQWRYDGQDCLAEKGGEDGR